jgi:dihydroorotate dehydrogenase
MGLNNEGAERIVNRLRDTDHAQPLGVNIAKTPDPAILGEDAINDYLFSYKEARKVADYITINISCPNTADGKTFEDPSALDELLSALLSENRTEPVPTLVKFSADLNRDELQELVEVCEALQIDGYAACNTSSSRENLLTGAARLKEIGDGGLSGIPIASQSLRIVKWLRSMIGDQKPIIGVGGIHSFETALHMLQAGANLLQVYTGLIYEGPALVKNINRELAAYMQENGLNTLKEIQ